MADRLTRSPAPDPDEAGVARSCRVRVTGVVQGVGYRPFVAHLGSELGLTGQVGNDADGVFATVTGPGPAVAAFLSRLREDAPGLAMVEHVLVEDDTVSAGPDPHVTNGRPDPSRPQGPVPARTGFVIVDSPARSAGGAATSIPPDTAVCADCLAELRDPTDRRFGYPFIACTHCGPRFTMVTGLPYDRAATTMADFPLCPACQAEYEDPGSRRFHAQPTACPTCGPQLSLPVTGLAAALSAGSIAAIKGVGGYHLACDAGDEQVVARLRVRKQRGAKPFALMVADLAAARRLVHLDADAEALLCSPARPIVLASSRDAGLQERVAPGNGFLGVMLAYTPLHHLIFDAGAPPVLVMTSGNLADEPICTDPDEAVERLRDIADVFCHHNRRIQVACDDSVVRVVAGHPQPVRRSRGYAPMPVALPLDSPPVVAVGGEIKATAAVAAGPRAWLSAHIGDTENWATLQMLSTCVDLLVGLQQVRPAAIVSDAHPGYLSHRWAAAYADRHAIAHLVVQHHHAHLASLLAEHSVPPGTPVLGVVFDGTGYGTDATIWGGELLLGSYAEVRRVGHLSPVLLPGGDAAIRFPARTAMAHLSAAGIDPAGSAPAAALGRDGVRVLSRMLATGTQCTPTTSAGRLFDAVSSLLDVRHEVDYEAQAAIELEALAARATREVGSVGGAGGHRAGWPAVPARRHETGTLVIDPAAWIARAVADHANGVPAGEAASAFHSALADSVLAAAEAVRDEFGVGIVGLTGGVFANAVLSADCLSRLRANGFVVLTHRVVPPNDGGLALGQVTVAAAGGASIRRTDVHPGWSLP